MTRLLVRAFFLTLFFAVPSCGGAPVSPQVIVDDVAVGCTLLLLVDPNVPDVAKQVCLADQELTKLDARPATKTVKLARPVGPCAPVSSAESSDRSSRR